MLITRRIFLTSSSIQPAYKIPAKRHLKQSRSATKKKSAEQLAQRLNDRGFALPFGPTRLADGLELEVFYATPIGITIRPGFRLAERWIPRVKSASRATSTSADNSFSMRRIILRKNDACNQDCLLAANEIGNESSPRRIMPRRHRKASDGTLKRNSGIRRNSVLIATSASKRASGAPRQKVNSVPE
jgi:hypothetical protein